MIIAKEGFYLKNRRNKALFDDIRIAKESFPMYNTARDFIKLEIYQRFLLNIRFLSLQNLCRGLYEEQTKQSLECRIKAYRGGGYDFYVPAFEHNIQTSSCNKR